MSLNRNAKSSIPGNASASTNVGANAEGVLVQVKGWGKNKSNQSLEKKDDTSHQLPIQKPMVSEKKDDNQSNQLTVLKPRDIQVSGNLLVEESKVTDKVIQTSSELLMKKSNVTEEVIQTSNTLQIENWNVNVEEESSQTWSELSEESKMMKNVFENDEVIEPDSFKISRMELSHYFFVRLDIGSFKFLYKVGTCGEAVAISDLFDEYEDFVTCLQKINKNQIYCDIYWANEDSNIYPGSTVPYKSERPFKDVIKIMENMKIKERS